MSTVEAIMEKLQRLSTDDQERVLDALNQLTATNKNGTAVSTNGAEKPQEQSIWSKLTAIGEAAEKNPCDLPSDLAANHDFYLHRLPRRT